MRKIVIIRTRVSPVRLNLTQNLTWIWPEPWPRLHLGQDFWNPDQNQIRFLSKILWIRSDQIYLTRTRIDTSHVAILICFDIAVKIIVVKYRYRYRDMTNRDPISHVIHRFLMYFVSALSARILSNYSIFVRFGVRRLITNKAFCLCAFVCCRRLLIDQQ
jgi:hypothetical protein